MYLYSYFLLPKLRFKSLLVGNVGLVNAINFKELLSSGVTLVCLKHKKPAN